jgi:hypothetical protein
MDRAEPLEARPRFVNRRQRAAELERRMLVFAAVYNAACLLRNSWHGSPVRRAECAKRFADVLAHELHDCGDHEALLYAVADALYCSPLGVPWEP